MATATLSTIAPVIQPAITAAVLSALTAAGIRVYVFQGKVGFGLAGNHDWDLAVPAWAMLNRLPGGHEALKRHILVQQPAFN